jgi:CDP-glycerol glycerophosphotransferase
VLASLGDRWVVLAVGAWRGLCWLLLRLVPPRRHAVVFGLPDDEGNAVEMVRALRRRYRGRVYWLLEDVRYPGPAFAAPELADRSRISRVQKDSLRAALLALTAETTIFSHGLFTDVVPPRNRLVVNVWHGDGLKFPAGTHLIRSSVVVAGTRLWAKQRPGRFGLPESAVATVGNPRIDQFGVTPPDDVLTRLGLEPAAHTVLWLPTYRAASGGHGRTWREADDLSSNTDVAVITRSLAAACAVRSFQLVVKPHPLDTDSFDDLGIGVLRHTALRAAGVTLYQLLGAVDAVISDVSSVWVDYLALDRPIAFYVPDLEDLHRRGKLNVDDPAALLPGPRIVTSADAVRFIDAVADDPEALRPSRHPAAERIGVVAEPGAADRLLDWLNTFQRRRGRAALFRDDGADVRRRPEAMEKEVRT